MLPREDKLALERTGLLGCEGKVLWASCLLFQLRVQVSDEGVPVLVRTRILTVNVLRNEKQPVFVSGQYNPKILETHPVGSTVIKVTATDSDAKV